MLVLELECVTVCACARVSPREGDVTEDEVDVGSRNGDEHDGEADPAFVQIQENERSQ